MSPWGTIISNFNSIIHIRLFSLGYSTEKPKDFKLQDDGSALAVTALTALYGL